MIHPGAWLTWAAAAGLAAISTTNPFYLVPLFAAAWVVHARHARPSPGARSFRAFVAFGVVAVITRTALVVLGSVTAAGVAAAFLEGLRVAVLLAIYGSFNSVADPYGVLRLAPRRFYEVALAAALALSIAPRTVDSLARVREAQRMRGITVSRLRAVPSLAVPVLEAGMEQAVTLAESMDARGHGRGPRSRYRIERFDVWSWCTAAAGLAAAGVFFVFTWSSSGDLLVETFPPAWPEASAWLVGAALWFGLPAWLPVGERR